MPQTSIPVKPGGITLPEKVLKLGEPVNRNLLHCGKANRGKTVDSLNGIAITAPGVRRAETADAFLTYVLHTTWPFELVINIAPGHRTSSEFKAEFDGAVAGAANFLQHQRDFIARKQWKGPDSAAPDYLNTGVRFGHSIGKHPMVMAVTVNPYAATAEQLRRVWPALSRALCLALDASIIDAQRGAEQGCATSDDVEVAR